MAQETSSARGAATGQGGSAASFVVSVARKASTISGSNWLPAQLRNSAPAAAGGIPGR